MRSAITRRGLFRGLAAALVLSTFGCGGGGGGSDGGGGSTATAPVTVAVTDAPSDDIDTFAVDLVSFRFVRRDGAVVEVLPQTTRVDLAQLVTVSEVIASASLPAGDYLRAFMTVDFTTATCLLTGSVTPAALRDDAGQPLGRQELEVVFPNGGFTCGPGAGRFAVVDFDLDQSLTVDVLANSVVVDAVLYADIDPAQPKVTRATGLTADFTDAGFTLDVRRLLGLVSRGLVTVTTDGATVFDLDGQLLVGAAGLDALEALGDGRLVAVDGPLNPTARSQAAARVVLLPQGLDAAEGLIVARSGGPGADPTLTLRGVSVTRAGGTAVTFNDTITVAASVANTAVRRRGVAGALTTDALQVGQRVVAYGLLSGSSLSLTAPGSGFVRLLETGVHGLVVGAPGSGLTLDVARIGARPVAAFDFAVSGVAQADPDALAVSTGGLALGGLAAGDPVTVRGFFLPVEAAAATPDFSADSVIDRSDAAALLRVHYLPASSTALVTSGTELALDLTGSVVAELDRGFGLRAQLSAGPVVTGSTSGWYAVRRGLTITLFRDFAAYRARLEADVAAGLRVVAFRALGREEGPGRFAAARAFVVVR